MAAEPQVLDATAVSTLAFHKFLKDNPDWRSGSGLVWSAYVEDQLCYCEASIPDSEAYITLAVSGDLTYWSFMYTVARACGSPYYDLHVETTIVSDMFHLVRLVDKMYTSWIQ